MSRPNIRITLARGVMGGEGVRSIGATAGPWSPWSGATGGVTEHVHCMVRRAWYRGYGTMEW